MVPQASTVTRQHTSGESPNRVPDLARYAGRRPSVIVRPQPTEEHMADGFEAHGLGKRYRRRHWALRHVDVVVPPGSITALVGPNGAGKSTLIKAGIGFERPTSGHV